MCGQTMTMWLRRTLLVTLTLAVTGAIASAQPPAPGRAAYERLCSSCHGADGEGAGHAPGFVNVRRPRAPSHAALRELVRAGIPEAGMPGFALPDAELDAIARYVEALRAPAANHPTEGDAGAGARFFNGPGGCARCHMVRGAGGLNGPDLSNLGAERRRAEIELALTDPDRARALRVRGRDDESASGRLVSLRLRDGGTLRGFVRYQSPFDLGLVDLTARFHSLAMTAVAALEVEPSPMPRLQATPAERRDLLAYLTRLVRDTSPAATFRGAATTDVKPAVAAAPETAAFAAIAKPPTGEWPTYHGHLSGNRHSPLDQINLSNVTRLAPRWTFPIPSGQKTLQTTPVVVEGLMYVTAANAIWALDARTGRQVWHYSRPRTEGLVGDPAAGINRGVAILGDRLFFQTDHAHVLALHRTTGHLLWDVEMADFRQHYGATSAPLVVNDLVIAGVSGGDEGNRGFLDAYRATTGERVWRFWTVPARGEPGSETWVGSALEHGCAATWLTGTYDPEARLLYWPTGNPCPDYNGDERKGDNLYSNSVLALDPDSGGLKWHFQFTPHDLHDWDATETPMLVDADFKGEPRKLLLHADRNGFFYALDRLSGELLLAAPFVKTLTWASGIDPKGRPILVPGQEPSPQGTRTCPSVEGATNWPSTAFNPATRLFYLMAQEGCGIFTKQPESWQQGRSFYGGTTRRAPDDPSVKYLRALDIESGKVVWEIPDVGGGIIASGVVSTAGGLVFYGDSTGGTLVAADARTGARLWHFTTGQPWRTSPMTYAVEGAQYLGVVAGATVMVFGVEDGR